MKEMAGKTNIVPEGYINPRGDPRPKTERATQFRVTRSGDGGNRTRVRKIRPSEIYERSRSKVVTAGISSGTNRLRLAALSFARVAASCAALRVCLARACPWRRSGQVDAVLLRRPYCYDLTLGGEGHSSIGSAVGT